MVHRGASPLPLLFDCLPYLEKKKNESYLITLKYISESLDPFKALPSALSSSKLMMITLVTIIFSWRNLEGSVTPVLESSVHAGQTCCHSPLKTINNIVCFFMTKKLQITILPQFSYFKTLQSQNDELKNFTVSHSLFCMYTYGSNLLPINEIESVMSLHNKLKCLVLFGVFCTDVLICFYVVDMLCETWWQRCFYWTVKPSFLLLFCHCDCLQSFFSAFFTI